MSKTAMDMIGVEEERIKPGMHIEIERGHFTKPVWDMRSIA